ncbi:hypothetical protein AMAG_19595 [Allomyces macrogynus ATCC 38327]|uniref:Uncharacterized protein n=1 Tax=Allomyces macrogynus (strain ATCC 38327) TaxID=578462 RepID=A0A0L0SW72_ALLM3|nr:hypothetical protein AMAG_19595 [Allomyces macrogynus ATCC 38327]|eukprot:KNE66584.1 hypothetical protein AMAG_19595 [Allomyces macrogynus ATCC 38327]
MLEVFARTASGTEVDVPIAGVDSTMTRRRKPPLPPGVASPTKLSRAALSGVFMARKTMLSAAGGFLSNILALFAKMQKRGARFMVVPVPSLMPSTRLWPVKTGWLAGPTRK